ncbi:MAG: hypothetical protein L6300_14520, partial [Syntrophaceae bacterium]|nr:hypothetical protein [Syntrophaceae bacterium]
WSAISCFSFAVERKFVCGLSFSAGISCLIPLPLIPSRGGRGKFTGYESVHLKRVPERPPPLAPLPPGEGKRDPLPLAGGDLNLLSPLPGAT